MSSWFRAKKNRYYESGKTETFRRITKEVTKGYTKKGYVYQSIGALDENGNECILQLFDLGDAKLIIKGGMFQFTNTEQ
jgi:hypothetical protein